MFSHKKEAHEHTTVRRTTSEEHANSRSSYFPVSVCGPVQIFPVILSFYHYIIQNIVCIFIWVINVNHFPVNTYLPLLRLNCVSTPFITKGLGNKASPLAAR